MALVGLSTTAKHASSLLLPDTILQALSLNGLSFRFNHIFSVVGYMPNALCHVLFLPCDR